MTALECVGIGIAAFLVYAAVGRMVAGQYHYSNYTTKMDGDDEAIFVGILWPFVVTMALVWKWLCVVPKIGAEREYVKRERAIEAKHRKLVAVSRSDSLEMQVLDE